MVTISFLHIVELVFTRLAPLPVRFEMVVQIVIVLIEAVQVNVNDLAVILQVDLDVFLFGMIVLVEPNREVQESELQISDLV